MKKIYNFSRTDKFDTELGQSLGFPTNRLKKNHPSNIWPYQRLLNFNVFSIYRYDGNENTYFVKIRLIQHIIILTWFLRYNQLTDGQTKQYLSTKVPFLPVEDEVQKNLVCLR